MENVLLTLLVLGIFIWVIHYACRRFGRWIEKLIRISKGRE